MEKIKFNDINREFVEDFIRKLPKEDKEKLREYVAQNPRTSSSAMFTMVKSYIYNTYFRQGTASERKSHTTNFADIFDSLLEDNEEKEIEEYN